MSTRQSQLLGLAIAALALCLVLAYVGQWAYNTFAPKPTPILSLIHISEPTRPY